VPFGSQVREAQRERNMQDRAFDYDPKASGSSICTFAHVPLRRLTIFNGGGYEFR